MRFSTIMLILMFLSGSANAGLFSDLVDKVKQTTDKVMGTSIDKVLNNSSDEQQATPQSGNTATTESKPPAATTSKPNYDHNLVKSIQQNLKDQGYPVGVIDGLYGNGTKKAIQAYQQDQGLSADGMPSQVLLTRLQSTAGQSHTAQQATHSSTGLPEPTMAALTLAAVHYRPDALDRDSTLKDVLYTVHPETNKTMSNEFQWHKQKAKLKQQLLSEAKTTPLQFEVKPWNKNSIANDRSLELRNYNFDRSTFQVSFATNAQGGILLAMMIPSQAKLEKQYPQGVSDVAINAQRAEQIDNYFKHQRRIFYPGYRINVTGADLGTGRPLPIVNFDHNRLKLFARIKTPSGNQMKTEYKQLATVSIPYDKKIAVKESAPKAYDNHKAANTDVISNAVVDGVHLGMDFDEAMAALKSHGFTMEKPGAPNKQLGIRVKGRKRAEHGRGSVSIYITSMGGKVYEVSEGVRYLGQLDDQTMQKLKQIYTDKFITPFKEARYSSKTFNGRIEFDDEKRPPYGSRVKSPHAVVILSSRHEFGAHFNMTWKGLVGANW